MRCSWRGSSKSSRCSASARRSPKSIRPHFFELGRIPGVFGDFHWSLDVPEAFRRGADRAGHRLRNPRPSRSPCNTRGTRRRGLCRVRRCARQWRANRQGGASGNRRPRRDPSGGVGTHWAGPQCAQWRSDRRVVRQAKRQAYRALWSAITLRAAIQEHKAGQEATRCRAVRKVERGKLKDVS